MDTARVLLVEDNPGDVRLIEEALAGEPFELVHVERLADVCARAAAEPFAAMLLDLSLPDSSGLETVRRAREAANSVPIVVLTGLGDESLAVAALAAGAQDYLVKGGNDYHAIARSLRYAIERQRLEARLREAGRLEATGQLAAGIAHQFNNVMTSILGYSDWLLHQPDRRATHRVALEEIARAAARAAELTRQLLAVGRRQTLNPGRIDLNQAIGDAAGTLREIAGSDMVLNLRCRPVAPIAFDGEQLEHVLATLVIYARAEMPSGGQLLLETMTAPADPQGQSPYVLLVCTDTSPGVDSLVKSRVFEPFHDLQELAARRRSGLELPSVHGVMAQSGGRIEFSVAPGGGNRFRLYFPTAEFTATRTASEGGRT